MDPPVRTPNAPLPFASRTRSKENSAERHSMATLTPDVHSPPLRSRTKRRRESDESQDGGKTKDLTSDDVLGQFSFGPATQTTVVTTTTTTTTSFPPLKIKAPSHLHELDPKVYPLASTPTPQSLKRFCFDVNGRPTVFKEAGNAVAAFEEVKQQNRALRDSGGVLRNVSKFESDYQTPDSSYSQLKKPGVVPESLTSSMSSDDLQRPRSPISTSKAKKAARQQAVRGRKPNAARTLKTSAAEVGSTVPGPIQSRLNICQTSTPITPSLDSGDTIRDRQLQVPLWDDDGDVSLDDLPARVLEPQQPNYQSSQRRTANGNALGAAIMESENDTRAKLDQAGQWGRGLARKTTLDETEHMESATAAASTLLEHAVRPRPHTLDTTAAQDASLPSPSLSPVTAAANIQSRRGGYFEDSNTDSTDVFQSFDASQADTQDYTDMETSERCRPTSARGLAHVPQETLAEDTDEPLSTPSLMDIPTMLYSFEAMPAEMKKYIMYQFLRRCPKSVLHTVADAVNPALKCDFLSLLPMELSLNIVGHLDFKALCSAAQVSRRWRQIIDSDEQAWKNLFDVDGYEMPEDELQRAIREGWGWQHASRPDDWEKDLTLVGQIPSDAENSVCSPQTTTPARGASVDNTDHTTTTTTKRGKRKAGSKGKSRARKQQKRTHDVTGNIDSDFCLTTASAAANAAASAVPYARIGLPSLKNLHLFKSIYQRHHIIRKSWMQEQTKPRHLAFRAHQRHVVTCLQFDTDKILTGSDDTNINVYDTQTGALRAKLTGHEGGVWALQYEGNVLVSGSTDRSVRVWDIERGVCTQVFQGHTSTVRCLQILMPTQIGTTIDGKPIMAPKQPLIITGSRDSNLRVWKLPKPGDEPFFQAGPAPDDADCPYFVRVLTGHHHSVRAIAAHADTLVSGSYDSSVRVWKISTGETVHRLTGHASKVYSVVLDHKRNRCISGSMDNLVKVWSLDTGTVLFNLEGHSSLVGLLDLQGDRLVSAAADSTLRIWDPENGYCKATLSAHTGAITCFQHDTRKVISGSDRTLKMWNVSNGQFVKDLLTDLSGVWQVKFNERRCVAAVQRNNLTYIEVLDFGACRDGVPESKRGRRIVVNAEGQEVSDPHDMAIDLDGDD